MRTRALGLLAIGAVIAAGIAARAISRSPGAEAHASAGAAIESPSSGISSRSLAAASSDPSASGAPAARDPSASGAPSANGAASTDLSATGQRARVVSTAPTGVRVPLDAPIVVQFDRAPVQSGVTITLDPPAETTIAWPDARTVKLTPARWAEGKPYHVRVEGADVEPATFEMRTRFPPPERIEPGHGERIVLTFDDGADKPAQATALLDLLAKEGVEATFFPTGRWAENNPRLLERMIADGHHVCNHTYSHQNLRLPQLTDGEVHTEIARGATDGKCRLFRPPLKAIDPRVERMVAQMGLTIYLWDVDSRDWEGATSEDILNLVLTKAHPGAVVLFHLHAQATLEALPVLLPRLRKAGYVFRGPPELATAEKK